jgi:hypothetical protein
MNDALCRQANEVDQEKMVLCQANQVVDQTDDDGVFLEKDLARLDDDLFQTDNDLCQAFEVVCHASNDLLQTTQVVVDANDNLFQATKVVVLTNQVLCQTTKVVSQTKDDVEQTKDDVYQTTKVVLLESPRLRFESDVVCSLEEHRSLLSGDVRLYKQRLCLASQHVPLHRHGE